MQRGTVNNAKIVCGRVEAALQQIPIAVCVTIANASLMAIVLSESLPKARVLTWLAAVTIVATGRLAIWFLHHRNKGSPWASRWSALASTGGAMAAGLSWGLGAVVLFPADEVYQLFWVFLIGGMSAGAASLHYPHSPTAIAFIVPACAPLAIRLALSGTSHQLVAAGMITIFVAALVCTIFRASEHFGYMLRLRLDLTKRTHQLDQVNAKLSKEIAEHRSTEASLIQSHKMEALGQLTGGLAHGFNNILFVVLGNLEMLRGRLAKGDAKAAQLLDSAFNGAERGAQLTQHLLAFGRRQLLNPEILDLESTIKDFAAFLSSSVGDRISIIFGMAPGLPPVKVDRNHLELALLNLALNARDAMPDGGNIKISVRQAFWSNRDAGELSPGTYVVVSLSDSGAGMDEATLNRAIDPFFTTKEPGKGTGLGLSMVHGFAAQSGGQLRLESHRGVGTIAELWFPEARSEAPDCPLMAEAPRIESSGAHTVLVVDDDGPVRAIVTSMLNDLGYATIQAGSAREALDLLSARIGVDLVVAEYAMPEMSGLELANEMHQLWPGLAAIIMSSSGEMEKAASCQHEWLPKPFDQKTLSQIVSQCLGQTATSVLQSAHPT